MSPVETWVAQQNVARFCLKIASARSSPERLQLENLLEEEREKLRAAGEMDAVGAAETD
jgi:hypothetical protein